MPVLYKIVTLQSRLAPAEVERRLLRITRKPRTLREVIDRVPKNPPEHPEFVGSIGDGAFTLTPLRLAPDDIAHSYIRRPAVRGRITARAQGSEIRLLFCDPVLSAMALGFSLPAMVLVLASTRGWPIWRMEHALAVLAVVGALGFCHLSLKTDIAESTRRITKLLS